MSELFDVLYFGIAKGNEVTMIVDGKAIPVIITDMETERFSYEQTMKIKLSGIVNCCSSVSYKGRRYIGIPNIPYNMAYRKVIFNKPATIVIWEDGSKTVVKCQKGDVYDPEKGLALCFMKKALGNKGNFNNVLKTELPCD